MLLVADVGNTNTKIGVFDGERLLVSWRLTSRREQTADEYGLFIETLLQSRGIRAATIDGVSISNVVPPVQQTLEWMCEKYFSRPPFFVEPGVNTRLPLAVDAPREVGADRYVDAFAAAAKYGPPLIVIDFGTATTFNCVNRRGEFIGGAIAPGIVTSVEALINRAARLSRVELVRPKEAIGRNTTTNLQSGAIYGYAGLVEGLVERMQAELGGGAIGGGAEGAGAAKVIATGGNAGLLTDVARCIERVDENLRLDGLRMLYEEAHPAASRR